MSLKNRLNRLENNHQPPPPKGPPVIARIYDDEPLEDKEARLEAAEAKARERGTPLYVFEYVSNWGEL